MSGEDGRGWVRHGAAQFLVRSVMAGRDAARLALVRFGRVGSDRALVRRGAMWRDGVRLAMVSHGELG